MKNFLAQIDLQDVLLLVGAALTIGGIAWISRPAGLITAGLLFLFLGMPGVIQFKEGKK